MLANRHSQIVCLVAVKLPAETVPEFAEGTSGCKQCTEQWCTHMQSEQLGVRVAYTLSIAVVSKQHGVLENSFCVLHVLGLHKHADPLLDSLQQ